MPALPAVPGILPELKVGFALIFFVSFCLNHELGYEPKKFFWDWI
jgi:hypothetical protein